MRFPAHFLDEIRSRIPIADVVGTRVTWDKRKSQPQRGDYWACCPFHGEKTPSFHADNRRGRYHCFGCGASGDHFRFLVELDGLSFPEAVARLADEAGLPLPEHLDGESFVSELKDPDNHFKDYAYSRYHWGESIISDRYIYTEWTRKSGQVYGRMLFDHETDPKENTNVSEKKAYRDVVKKMKGQLSDVRNSIK